MPAIPLHSPVYRPPLAKLQLEIVGRITLVWSQIDGQVDVLVMHAYGLGYPQFDHLFANKTITPKLEALRVAVEQWPDSEKKAKMFAMTSAVTACVPERNLITHGQWGWHWNKETRMWDSCAWTRQKQRRFEADSLVDLHNRVVDASYLCDEVHHEIIGLSAHIPWQREANQPVLYSSVSPADPEGPPGPPEVPEE